MSKGGWARLIKQEQPQAEIDHHKENIHSKEQLQQQSLIAQLQSMNANSCCVNTSTVSTVNTTSARPVKDSMMEVALHDEGVIKASKFFKIVRRWRSQSVSRRRSVMPTPRLSSSCTILSLMPLSCVASASTHVHSDDEEEEEDEDDKRFVSDQSRSTTPIRRCSGAPAASRSPARRALSCPRLGSPLGLCTPFPSMQARYEDEYDEELECFKPREGAESMKLSPSSSSSSSIRLNMSKAPTTPKGYLALYVGEERRRFLVKANLVNHPLFGILLDKAKQEFGFDQKGPLNIPCEISLFQHIMLLVESNDPSYSNADHSSILLHFNSAPNLQAAAVI